MKISSQRLKEIIQEEIYNLEMAEVLDLKDLADNEMKKVTTNLKTLEPLLLKIVGMVDKAAQDAAEKVGAPEKAAEYKAIIANAIQGKK